MYFGYKGKVRQISTQKIFDRQIYLNGNSKQ